VIAPSWDASDWSSQGWSRLAAAATAYSVTPRVQNCARGIEDALGPAGTERGVVAHVTPTSLEDWQQRLAERFSTLRTERDAVRPGSPIFALEHGLSIDHELPQLQLAVRRVVEGPRLPRSLGLPFVVYAAEVGYGYQGDEFWPVFEAATPKWTSHGIDYARRFIRHRFEEFADIYGGAHISGRWALWFKNIAWPITHAVLPTDLQRHLARLLYDYRTALTADLLDDYEVLGERLARRSLDTSARFRKFAENTELLGLVAAALLVGEEEHTPLLTSEVLQRIVRDLSKERQAGAWLLDAKRAAVRIRRRGWMPRSAGGGTPQPAREEAAQRIEATLSLRRSADGWRGYVIIPSHESLARRVPSVQSDLERTRYRVHGVRGMQSLGALMYDRGPMPFERWPPADGQSLVELEDSAASQAIGLLADHCRLPPGPWLFRMSEPGVAVEVRTRTVRPGADYVLVSRDHSQVDGVGWHDLPLATAEACAIGFHVPTVVDQTAIDGLLSVGISVAPEVSIRPAGLIPAAWDGEGAAAWSAGESPLLAIQSSHAVSRCIVSTDVEAKDFAWPDDSDTAFIQVGDLPPGSQMLEVALLDEQGAPLTHGSFTVQVREPVDSSSSASARQGLQLRSFPPHPSLNDLWSGASNLEVTGPPDERVQFEIVLTSLGGGTPLSRTSFSSLLPVTEQRSAQLLRSAQGSNKLDEVLGDSEEMVVRVTHAALGSSEVRAGRPFEPLRWATGRDRAGPYARLINHAAERPAIQYSPPDHPATVEAISYDDEEVLRLERGGLIVATCGDLEAAVVVPPRVRGDFDALRLLNVRPTLQTGPRTAESVRGCISLARRWGGVAVPADATAAHVQKRVLDAIRSRLGGLIGGQYWWEVEHQLLNGAAPSADLLLSGIGHGRDERRIAHDLLNLRRSKNADQSEVADTYVDAVATQCRWLDHSITGLVARLARAPEALDERDPRVVDAIQATLDRPASFRLARLLVVSESIDFSTDGSGRP
jgi:hypothetical protein